MSQATSKVHTIVLNPPHGHYLSPCCLKQNSSEEERHTTFMQNTILITAFSTRMLRSFSHRSQPGYHYCKTGLNMFGEKVVGLRVGLVVEGLFVGFCEGGGLGVGFRVGGVKTPNNASFARRAKRQHKEATVHNHHST